MRNCVGCGKELTACMGFVVAGDILDQICECDHPERGHKWQAAECMTFGCSCNKYVRRFREVCGACAFIWEDSPDTLPLRPPSISAS